MGRLLNKETEVGFSSAGKTCSPNGTRYWSDTMVMGNGSTRRLRRDQDAFVHEKIPTVPP